LEDLKDEIDNTPMTAPCTETIKQNYDLLLNGTLMFNETLLTKEYKDDAYLAGLINTTIQLLRDEWEKCKLYDNRTVFIPENENRMTNLSGLYQEILNSNTDDSCKIPLLVGIDILYNLTAEFNQTMLDANITYDIDLQISDELTQNIVDLYGLWEECKVYDPRNEVVQNFTDIVSKVQQLINDLKNSTADPACIEEVLNLANQTLVYAQYYQQYLFTFNFANATEALTNSNSGYEQALLEFEACKILTTTTTTSKS
jgi:hypothetical protein